MLPAPALLLSCSHAMLVSCFVALLLSCSPLSCSLALMLSRYLLPCSLALSLSALWLSCSFALFVSCSVALTLAWSSLRASKSPLLRLLTDYDPPMSPCGGRIKNYDVPTINYERLLTTTEYSIAPRIPPSRVEEKLQGKRETRTTTTTTAATTTTRKIRYRSSEGQF